MFSFEFFLFYLALMLKQFFLFTWTIHWFG